MQKKVTVTETTMVLMYQRINGCFAERIRKRQSSAATERTRAAPQSSGLVFSEVDVSQIDWKYQASAITRVSKGTKKTQA